MTSTNNITASNSNDRYILRADTEPLTLTGLFCLNQANFYRWIARYTASNDNNENNNNGNKPIRFFNVDNIDLIVSPNVHYAFYNTILSTDIYNDVINNSKSKTDVAPELTLRHITQIGYKYHIPLRITVSPNASSDTHRILHQNRWLKLISRTDSYQYIDFNDNYNINLDPYSYLTDTSKSNDIQLLEIDDTINQCIDCRTNRYISLPRSNYELKYEWGKVLTQSFGFRQPEIHSKFYATVWSQVKVGPKQQIRMFIALHNNNVIGGSHLSVDQSDNTTYPSINKSTGISVLFNVVALPSERGYGLGKALSIVCVKASKQMNYRYMLLQASPSGSPVYKRIGFQSLPSYHSYLKLATADWYCGIIEYIVSFIGTQHLFNTLTRVDKFRQHISYYINWWNKKKE